MWKRVIITVSGTMQRVVAADNYANSPQATSLIVQMLEGSSGDIGYLQMGCPIGTTLDHTQAIQLVKAAAGVPGTPFVYQCQNPEFGERIDIGQLGVDGAHDGDTILVQWWEIIK
jgi:hypothetical protein